MSTNDYTKLLVSAPLASGGAGGDWIEPKTLEVILGEAVTLAAPNTDSAPTFTVFRKPSGSSTTFSTATATPDVPGLYVFRATFANSRIADLRAFAWPAAILSHNAIRYFMRGEQAARFDVGMNGQTVIVGPQRPAPAQRRMLAAMSQDAALLDVVGARVEANAAITPAAALAGLDVAPWESTQL